MGKEKVAQRRREDARARCELFFNLHAADIGNRFPRKVFDNYIARYMSNEHEPEQVELRADQLLQTLQQSLDKVAPAPRFRTLADINKARQEERQVLLDSDLDNEMKESQLIRLEEKYDELVNKFFDEKDR